MSPRQLLRQALDAGPALILTLPMERRRWADVGQVFGEWLEDMGDLDRARLSTLSWAMLPWEALSEELGLSGPRPDLILVGAELLEAVLWPKLKGLSAGEWSADRAPLGACWAQATGCGLVLEGRDQQNRMDCGMGYVPEGSRRFLALIDDLEPM